MTTLGARLFFGCLLAGVLLVAIINVVTGLPYMMGVDTELPNLDAIFPATLVILSIALVGSYVGATLVVTGVIVSVCARISH